MTKPDDRTFSPSALAAMEETEAMFLHFLQKKVVPRGFINMETAAALTVAAMTRLAKTGGNVRESASRFDPKPDDGVD
jgi:hypothetical protein